MHIIMSQETTRNIFLKDIIKLIEEINRIIKTLD